MGTSVVDFFERFPDETACLDHVANMQLRLGYKCPQCGTEGEWKHIKGSKKYYHSCKFQRSPLAKTVFARSNLSLMAWFYALLLMCNSGRGIKAAFLRKHLGIGMKAAHRLGTQLRVHIACAHRPDRVGGPGKKVYVDEALLNLVRDLPDASNAIVMGVACEGIVLCGQIRDRKAATLMACIERFVEPGSIIVTDGYIGYHRLAQRGWSHIVVNHSIAFHDFEGNTTTDIDSFWAVLKRTLKTYRQVKNDYLWLYLAEVEYLYNRRHAEQSPFDELVNSFGKIDEEAILLAKRKFTWSS